MSDIEQLAPTGTLRGAVVTAPAASAFFAIDLGKGPRGVTVDLLHFFAERLKLLDECLELRQSFGRLHGLSVACLGAGGLAALVILVLLVRLTSRSTA